MEDWKLWAQPGLQDILGALRTGHLQVGLPEQLGCSGCGAAPLFFLIAPPYRYLIVHAGHGASNAGPKENTTASSLCAQLHGSE